MPRLNLIRDIKELENVWEDYCWGWWVSDLDCTLPKRESIGTKHRDSGYWVTKWRGIQRVGDMSIWRFINHTLENNIGKSFDQCYSYYCRKTKGIVDRHYWFMNEFIGRYNYYYVDDEGLIQKVKRRHRWKKDHTKLRDFETFSGEVIPEVKPKSNQWKKLRSEYNKAERRNDRLLKAEKKAREYCFLTKSEIELAMGKINDQENLERHGFDENSFKGNPYHGRKNKK